MAIYGVGTNWNGREVKRQFFKEDKIMVTWNRDDSSDIYSFLSALKVGDIIYLKSNKPGARTIRVKGVGIVTKNLLFSILNNTEENSVFVNVKWVYKKEFRVEIPDRVGQLTNIRSSSVYEEYLPFVCEAILERIFLY